MRSASLCESGFFRITRTVEAELVSYGVCCSLQGVVERLGQEGYEEADQLSYKSSYSDPRRETGSERKVLPT